MRRLRDKGGLVRIDGGQGRNVLPFMRSLLLVG